MHRIAPGEAASRDRCAIQTSMLLIGEALAIVL
jgi:hypothetical protein